MSTSPLLRWGGATLQVAADGTWARLLDGADLVVQIGWVGAGASAIELEAEDEVEHSLHTLDARVLQRFAVADQSWRCRWVLERPSGPLMVENRLRIRPGPDYTLWSWGSGVSAVLAVAPAHAAGPVLGIRVEQGYLEQSGPPTAKAAGVDYLIAPAGLELAAGQRLVTALNCQWNDDIDALLASLPPWVGDTQLDEDEPWRAQVADYGLRGSRELQINLSEQLVEVSGPLGRHLLEVHTSRGLNRVPLEWVPPVQPVLRQVAEAALAKPEDLGLAGALCVQFAADRHLCWLDPTEHEWLDRLTWPESESVLGVAFGLARGRALGEAGLVAEALRVLGKLPVGVGYGRLAMAGWLASLSVGIDARARCMELLRRPAVGRTAALESSLVHYRSQEFAGAALAGVANRLGGLLPGEAPLLDWVEVAQLVGILELCPAEWDSRGRLAEVAEKARGQILCAYSDARISDPEPLAWLLLGAGLGAGH